MGTVLWSLLDERSDEIDVAEVAAEFLAVGDVDEHFQRLGGVHEALRGCQLAYMYLSLSSSIPSPVPMPSIGVGKRAR